VLCVEFILVTTTVDIEQWYCVLCLVYNGYRNSRYSAMILCFCVEFIVVTPTIGLVQ